MDVEKLSEKSQTASYVEGTHCGSPGSSNSDGTYFPVLDDASGNTVKCNGKAHYKCRDWLHTCGYLITIGLSPTR